jgi:UDP-N-acetylmuramate--alanine ligase
MSAKKKEHRTVQNKKNISDLSLPFRGAGGSVYFIGIGGIGMSALARYFREQGCAVSGYDKTPTELTRQLEAEGMAIHYTEDVNAIPKDAALVVYTPAVPKGHAELVYYQTNGYNVVKRSQVLGLIIKEGFSICVAGTHGKTTTSAMIAHLLRHSGYGCTTFLGGIASNYNNNYWKGENNVFVVEADEYDRSFLQLHPDIAIITSMDPDHLDIYGTEEAMQDAFVAFGNQIKNDGLFLHKFGLKRTKEIAVKRKWSYSPSNDAAQVFAANIEIQDGGYRFDVHLPDAIISGLKLNIGGMHNVENAVAAIAVAHALEIEDAKIKAALADFKGVRRRFEYVLPPRKREEGAFVQPVLVDDYAHHPEELRALLKSVRSLFPQRLLTVVFQPHLFSRTRDLAEGFADALSLADRVILLPIYPARELPMEGVTSELILKEVKSEEKMLLEKEAFLQWMKEHTQRLNKEFGEVVVMAGAGDIDVMVGEVKKILE